MASLPSAHDVELQAALDDYGQLTLELNEATDMFHVRKLKLVKVNDNHHIKTFFV